MKNIAAVLLISLFTVSAFPDRAYARDRNRSRNLLIATSALGGTLAGAVLGIFADRAFLVNSPSADQPVQPISNSPAGYQQSVSSHVPAPQYYGYQTGPITIAPVYVAPPTYPSDPQLTGYSDGYMEGLRRGRQQRYHEARHQGYEAGYAAGFGR
jgi:hypothetical protein